MLGHRRVVADDPVDAEILLHAWNNAAVGKLDVLLRIDAAFAGAVVEQALRPGGFDQSPDRGQMTDQALADVNIFARKVLLRNAFAMDLLVQRHQFAIAGAGIQAAVLRHVDSGRSGG